MTQTQTVEFTVIGKDRLFDPWTTQTFTDRSLAQRWAARRAFVLPDSGGNDIRVSAAS